jgi:ERCC4-type nuclease
VQAQALARKVFDPLPVHFHELRALVPDDAETSVALTIRNDAHSDLDPRDDPTPVTIDERHPLPCAYVVKDTSTLDPARLQHPLPEPVRLLVDHREPASIITALRRVTNLEVARTELPVGDYMVEGRIVIERKSNDDFHASLKEGANHLMKQVERMAETGLHRVLVVEGGLYARRQFILNRLVSTESYIQHVHGIHIMPTMNRQHSVYAIVQAIKHTIFGMFSDVHSPDPLDKREIANDPSRTVRMLLSHLQGVSEERVNALCDHFGTFAAIAAADVEHLREVRGIGPKTAAQIHEVFHHRISASPR